MLPVLFNLTSRYASHGVRNTSGILFDSHSFADPLVLRLSILRSVHWNCNWFHAALSNCALCPDRPNVSLSSEQIDSSRRCPRHTRRKYSRSSVFLVVVSFFLSPYLSLHVSAICHRIFQLLVVTTGGSPSTAGSPRSLRFFSTEVSDAVTLKTNNGRRGHGIEAALSESLPQPWPGDVLFLTVEARDVGRRRRMWFPHTSPTVNLFNQIGLWSERHNQLLAGRKQKASYLTPHKRRCLWRVCILKTTDG